MNYQPPNKILITSDENILELKQVVKLKNKEDLYLYEFIKSETKLNMEVGFSEIELKRNLNNYFKVIE